MTSNLYSCEIKYSFLTINWILLVVTSVAMELKLQQLSYIVLAHNDVPCILVLSSYWLFLGMCSA